MSCPFPPVLLNAPAQSSEGINAREWFALYHLRKTGAGAGPGMPSLVAPLHHDGTSFPKSFKWSSVLLSVPGALSVLLGCGMRHDQHLPLLCCCCVRVRGVCVFLFFLYRPDSQKARNFFYKTPRPHRKRSGACFYAYKS